MLSEISTPNFENDLAAQKKYIEQILNRGRGEKEEQDLQDCFDSLKKGSNYKADDFEDQLSQSDVMSEASSSKQSFYKPQIVKPKQNIVKVPQPQ